MPDQDSLKQAAAEAAMAFLPPAGVVGLGTGTTARHAIRLIAERIASQEVPLFAVATSAASARAAAKAGIPLLGDDGPWDVAVTFDGADEVAALGTADGAATRSQRGHSRRREQTRTHRLGRLDVPAALHG